MGNSKIKKRILIIFAMLAILLSSIVGFSNTQNSASANFINCSSMGTAMGTKKVGGVTKAGANEASKNREWTVEELLGNAVAFTVYHGEGPETFLYKEKVNRGAHVDGYEEVLPTLEAAQGGCFNFNFIPNMFLGISNGISSMTGSIIMTLVGKDFMTETLTKIVGGANNNKSGLIGTFLESLYFPLIVITALIMIVTIIYKGLVQFKLREALSSILWTVGAFVIGVMLMFNPKMLVGIPQAATSTITTCVLGALSGQNCLSSSVEAPSVLASKECISTVAKGNDSESVVNSLNCTIWKSFVLEPWAEAQFGAPYNELYTDKIPKDGSRWKNLPDGKGKEYCISLVSSKSYSDSVKSTPVMNSSKSQVCNVALYQLFLKTNMKDTETQKNNNIGDKNVIMTDATGKYDSRWYDIIVPMAGDSSRWNNWEGSEQWGARIGAGFMSFISIIASSTVLLTLAVLAGAYKIIGLVLMAFSPIFFLFAIEPTRGRRIFLGWLEALVSSILKYFAITVLVLISLVMYSGLLENTTGVQSLIGVIILTITLHMYRKEIIDLIGATNLGGQRLSNRANDLGSWMNRQAKQKGAAIVGGAIGGASGQRSARRARIRSRNKSIEDLQEKLESAQESGDTEAANLYSEQLDAEKALKNKEGNALTGNVKETFKGTFKGGYDSFSRSMRRGTGIAANIAAQSDRTKRELGDRDKESATVRQNATKKVDEEVSKRQTNQDNNSNNNQTPNNATILTTDVLNENHNIEETTITKDQAIELELNALNLSGDNFELKSQMDDNEKELYQRYSNNIKNNVSDEDLMKLLRSEEVLQDPNKKEIASKHLNARINAYQTIGIESEIFANASSYDRAEDMDIYKKELEVFKSKFELTHSENDLYTYLDGLAQTGVSSETLDNEYAQLRKASGMNMNNIEYRQAVETVINKGEATPDLLAKEMDISNRKADDLIAVMAHDGIISKLSENDDYDTKREVLVDNVQNAEKVSNEAGNSTIPNPDLISKDLYNEIIKKNEYIDLMKKERVERSNEISENADAMKESFIETSKMEDKYKEAKGIESNLYSEYLFKSTPENKEKHEQAAKESAEIKKQYLEAQAKQKEKIDKMERLNDEWTQMEKDHNEIIQINEENIMKAKNKKEDILSYDEKEDFTPFKKQQTESNNNQSSRTQQHEEVIVINNTNNDDEGPKRRNDNVGQKVDPKPEPNRETRHEQSKPEPNRETRHEQSKPEPKRETRHEQSKPEPKRETRHEQPKPEPNRETRHEQPKPEPKHETKYEQSKPESKRETGHEQSKPEPKRETRHEQPKPEPKRETRHEQPKPEPKHETKYEKPNKSFDEESLSGRDSIDDMMNDLFGDNEDD